MSYSYIEGLALENINFSTLMLPIEAATEALCRLDERLFRSEALADGFISRTHYQETCANLWMDGELIHLKDLVLHDVEADIRAPTHELTRGAHLLHLRRRLFNQQGKWPIDKAGILNLINRPDGFDNVFNYDEGVKEKNKRVEKEKQKEDHVEGLYKAIDEITERSQNIIEQIKSGEKIKARNTQESKPKDGYASIAEDVADPLEQWLELIEFTKKYPAVFAAAILLDAWLLLKPIENSNAFGRLLCCYILNQRLTGNVMPPIIKGLQKSRKRWQSFEKIEVRLAIILEGFELAGGEAMSELDRLSLAHERMMLAAKKCRSNSSLPGLIDLFIQYPVVSTASASKALNITPRAVDQLLKQLGSAVPRERTGRGRYRMWGII